jgi:hypothetical protein
VLHVLSRIIEMPRSGGAAVSRLRDPRRPHSRSIDIQVDVKQLQMMSDSRIPGPKQLLRDLARRSNSLPPRSASPSASPVRAPVSFAAEPAAYSGVAQLPGRFRHSVRSRPLSMTGIWEAEFSLQRSGPDQSMFDTKEFGRTTILAPRSRGSSDSRYCVTVTHYAHMYKLLKCLSCS